jgi:hypothetical protein
VSVRLDVRRSETDSSPEDEPPVRGGVDASPREVGPPPAGEPLPDRRPSPFALRAGYELVAWGEQADAAGAGVVGLAYGFRTRSSVQLELGLDVGTVVDVGDSASRAVALRTWALFAVGRGYLLAGGAACVESVTDSVAGDEYANGSFGLDLGGGYRMPGGRLDVRFSYRALLVSDNVPGRAAISIGYGF